MTTASEVGNEQAAPATHEGYRIVIEPAPEPIRAILRRETIVDSARALVMHETRLPQVFYFPRDDVRMEFLVPSDHHTNCPFKGNASYWSLDVGGKTIENAVWSYEDPYDEAAAELRDMFRANEDRLREFGSTLARKKSAPKRSIRKGK